ncbi:MAG: tetratricopeptide repeat protein, partial [Candidatus Competibacterales bacterium]|nr:tetratricopeptide repeat protein [Candidatus Competibacterales bacterium]
WGDPLAFHYDNARKAPHKFRPQYNLATELGIRGRLDEAETYLERALAIDPDFSEAHNQLGNVYLLRGELDAAIRQYRRAVALQPRNAVAWYNLGQSLERRGDRAGAVHSYRRFLDTAPPDMAGYGAQIRARIRRLSPSAPETDR